MENLSNYLIVDNKLKKDVFSDPVFTYHYNDISRFLIFKDGQDRYTEIMSNVIKDYEDNKLLIKFKNNIHNIKKYITFECKYETHNMKMSDSEITLISVGGYGQIYKISDDVCLKINLAKEDFDHEYEIPKQLSKMENNTIKQLILTPYSIIKHCKFTGLLNILHINIFFVYIIHAIIYKQGISAEEIEEKLNSYTIKNQFNKLFNTSNKQKLKNATDLYNFFCSYYLNEDEHINILKFLPRLTSMFRNKDGKLKETGFIILMPLLKSNSISLRINKDTKKIDNINGVRSYLVYPEIYRMLFLQMSLLLLNINDVTNFTHNDFKADNVLVDEASSPYELRYKNNVFKFTEYFKFKLADFDFSLLQEYTPNYKLTNKQMFKETYWLTDIHFFIHSLFFFISSDEYKSDKMFFDKLHDKFIQPYCNISISKLLSGDSCIKKKYSKVYCNSGRLFTNEQLDIYHLHNFIISDLFKKWM